VLREGVREERERVLIKYKEIEKKKKEIKEVRVNVKNNILMLKGKVMGSC
jgi:hypothetical protein